jgi:hypothetical protein
MFGIGVHHAALISRIQLTGANSTSAMRCIGRYYQSTVLAGAIQR